MQAKSLQSIDSLASFSGIAYWIQWGMILFWIPAMLYLVYFAPYPIVHDQLHSFRHAFVMIGCH